MYLKQKKKNNQKNQQKNQTKTKFFKYIEDESKDISYELFKECFNSKVPSSLAKKLFETKGKKKNDRLANVINSGLKDLKEEIKKMSKEEIGIEKPNKIVNIVEEIIEFNKKIQSGQGLKILSPNQMLSRLPSNLAQLKAGNNSEKLKSEIRQLLYSLYRSKKLTKQLYKSLIDII